VQNEAQAKSVHSTGLGSAGGGGPFMQTAINPGFAPDARLTFFPRQKKVSEPSQIFRGRPLHAALPLHCQCRRRNEFSCRRDAPELAPLWRPSDMRAHRCNASDTRRHCASRRFEWGPIQTVRSSFRRLISTELSPTACRRISFKARRTEMSLAITAASCQKTVVMCPCCSANPIG